MQAKQVQRNKAKVILIRTNSLVSDPRVNKETQSLLEAEKYEVFVLAWDREARGGFVPKNLMKVKSFSLKTSYRSFRLVLYLPIFWVWVFLQLISNQPRVVHSIDEDTIVPAYLYKKCFPRKTRLIFEVCDMYSQALYPSKRLFQILRILLRNFEVIFASKADRLITATEFQAQTLGQNHLVTVVPNYPDFSFVSQELIRRPKTVKSGQFRLVHAGTLRRDYGLELLCKACEGLDDVELIFAGRLSERDLARAVSERPNTQYMGELAYEQALVLEATADAIPILCDPKRKAALHASPNRLFEAMMFGLPVIVSSNLRSASQIVSNSDCGIVVGYDVDAVRKAIVFLKENKKRADAMGRNGQQAFRNAYNWKNTERKLLEAYSSLRT